MGKKSNYGVIVLGLVASTVVILLVMAILGVNLPIKVVAEIMSSTMMMVFIYLLWIIIKWTGKCIMWIIKQMKDNKHEEQE